MTERKHLHVEEGGTAKEYLTDEERDLDLEILSLFGGVERSVAVNDGKVLPEHDAAIAQMKAGVPKLPPLRAAYWVKHLKRLGIDAAPKVEPKVEPKTKVEKKAEPVAAPPSGI